MEIEMSPGPGAAHERAVPEARMGEEGLARLVGVGSEAAFRTLYLRYHRQLYRYCVSILRHEADAQDALQSAFASAYSALRRGRRDAPVRPWLFGIAHNEAVNVLRQRRSEGELSEGLLARDLSVEERAEERERLERLVADLRELPDRQRAALVMRELSGLSHAEIAVALHTSDGTAKQAIFEARRSLAELEEGRAMACDEICRSLSDLDKRVVRSRKVRAHLRSCAACAAFAEGIQTRSADLRALAPTVPVGAALALLARSTGRGTSGSSPAGMAGGTAGNAALSLATTKVAATVVVLAIATVGVSGIASPLHSLAGSRLVVPRASSSSLVSHGNAGLARRTEGQSGNVGGRAPAGKGSSMHPGLLGAPAPGRTLGSGPARRPGSGGGPGSGASSLPATSAAPGRAGSGTTGNVSAASTAPGNSGAAPGHSGAAPGNSGAAPGNSGAAPGHSGAPRSNAQNSSSNGRATGAMRSGAATSAPPVPVAATAPVAAPTAAQGGGPGGSANAKTQVGPGAKPGRST